MDTRNFPLQHPHDGTADAGAALDSALQVAMDGTLASSSTDATDSADACCSPGLISALPQPPGSRRRRLWELGGHTHCPVIGVCLPLSALRRLADKVLGGRSLLDDYELHCGAVADSQRRSALAEALQRELDRRFLLPLRSAAHAKTSDALAAWWQTASAGKDLPGALWATLTHARCDTALENKALAQVHMLQHQVGMATRVELARFEALIDENAVLARELGAAQRRCTQQVAQHEVQLETLRAEAVRLRGQLLARDSSIALLQAHADSVHAAAPDLASRMALARDNAGQAERIVDLRRALQASRAECERLQAAAAAAAQLRPTLPARSTALVSTRLPVSTPMPELAAPPADPAALNHRAVLCVGGRTASVPVYRRLVEDRGARFLHHDGGTEDKVQQLDATLAAADLVICQAGCVSHDAYWRVKDHCKRTGKRCIFVETPSATGLQRALAALSATFEV